MYIYIYIYIHTDRYIYIYICIERERERHVCIHISISRSVSLSLYIPIYIYIYIIGQGGEEHEEDAAREPQVRGAAVAGVVVAAAEEHTLGPPKRGVAKPTVYRFPRCPSYRNVHSCWGQWSVTYL